MFSPLLATVRDNSIVICHGNENRRKEILLTSLDLHAWPPARYDLEITPGQVHIFGKLLIEQDRSVSIPLAAPRDDLRASRSGTIVGSNVQRLEFDANIPHATSADITEFIGELTRQAAINYYFD